MSSLVVNSSSESGMPCPLRTAIAGIGGFASSHHEVFAGLEAAGTARVVATCDPAADRLRDIQDLHRFAERGVKIHQTFERRIENEKGNLDLGVIASPIPHHAPMHAAVIAQGAACYLEKPPTLDPEEFAGMVEIEKSAAFKTNVGFAYVHLPGRIALKRRILAGEFGALRRASFLGLAMRRTAYYQRSNWAGKLVLGNSLVLDSCMGNALAHFLNNLLFFAGSEDLRNWARPAGMACELYRANPIEGTDTIFAMARLRNGVEMRIAASHACPNRDEIIEERLVFENAALTIRGGTQVAIVRPDRPEETFSIGRASLAQAVGHYCGYLTGSLPHPAQTLEDCRGFVETNALFYLAGRRIQSIPVSSLRRNGDPSAVVIPDIADAAHALIENGALPSQAGFAWANEGGSADTAALPLLRRTVMDLAAESPEAIRELSTV